MKTDFRKWLPVIVMAVAVGGAFTTHAMNEKAESNAIVTGHIKTGDMLEPCKESIECTTVDTGINCTVEYEGDQVQLYELESPGVCNNPLFRPLP